MVELKITADEQGNVQVSGPIANKMLCYGMLAMAHDAIRDFAAKQAESRIAVVGALPSSQLKGH